jgi:flagellar basal body-associated protein FliL
MKYEGKARALVFIYHALWILLFVIGLLLMAGALYALVFNRKEDAAKNALPRASVPEGQQIFTGIGRVRVSSDDGNSPMVIVSVTFPYFPADKPFSEELASRIGDFRTIAADYFKSFSAAGLNSVDESSLKEELLNRYNGILRLGRIEILYFNDFLVIE